MKADIHPDYHDINVKMTDGSTFTTRSTWGKEGDTLVLDVDSKSHPAWTGSANYINEKAGKVAKFSSKFGTIGQKKKAAAPAANNDDNEEKKDN